ncbi:hypothetical protein CISIN_1g046664mg [Citrus sinensis]|uniref:Uncharacterized protein n=1 Tax=Citrus sinensis TaxID=2711 RepID=A0A067D2N4_CITSI|nr:hypothetical protein CISIN_1g046664mg [Citrus sinensis]
MAWSNVSKSLMSQIEQIEGGLRLMVPALIGRIKTVQRVIGEAIKEEMDDMVSVFVDANRLRKSVIAEIVGALSVHSSGFVS